ncbi:MAG: ATP-binding protein [Bacteroidales bacterium]|jgi:molecular chaperone HtpG|nr:ATP-binding protein [Bacteroidales bacterium]
MNTNERFKPVIGKNVIENLTVGMYDDPRFVYREYVQNAADQIDVAKCQNLYQSDNEACIYIQIDKKARTIIIEDNATGIKSPEVLPLLGNIAQSTKNKYEDKGFRGIGRLGGLGYCDKLTFETSFYGEEVKSIMIWDAKLLKNSINDDSVKIDAAELISIITDYSFQNENKEEHYFKVTMEGVENEELLDVEKVRDYLSMVAPIPFASHFTHRHKIYEEARKNNVALDEYKLLLNGEQLFKGYKNTIHYNKKEFCEIIDIRFFEAFYNDSLLHWGWYGVSEKMYQIPDENKERGIRLRKSNIQIGLENRLDVYHKEKLGNRYFVGEVYAINKKLTPNARRDFFIENEECSQLVKQLQDFFHRQLYNIYYDFSRKNTAIKAKQDLENKKEKIKDETLDTAIKEKLSVEIKKLEKDITSLKKSLPKLLNKYQNKDAVLHNMLEKSLKDAGFDFDVSDKIENPPEDDTKSTETKYTQISAIQKKPLSPQETTLLEKVYNVIRQNLIRKAAEELIQKIEDDLKK